MLLSVSCSRRVLLSGQDPTLTKDSFEPIAVELRVDGRSESSIVVDPDSSFSVDWTAPSSAACGLSSNSSTVAETQGSGRHFVSGFDSPGVFTVRCTANGHTAIKAIGVGVAATGSQPISVRLLAADPSGAYRTVALQLPYLAATSLRWESTGASECALVAPSGAIALQALNHSSGFPVPPLTQSQVWAVICRNTNASIATSIVLDVIPPPPVVSFFTLNGTNTDIASGSGGTVNLAWAASFAGFCELRNQVGQRLSTGTAATFLLPPLLATETFRLDCYGPGGQTTELRRVNVVSNPPLVQFTANGSSSPITIAYESDLRLEWIAQNTAPCVVRRDEAVLTGTSPMIVSALTTSAVFSIACPGVSGGSAVGSIAVSVMPPGGHIAFISSSVHTGALGGATGADAICQSLANNAGIRPDRPWKAILSDGEQGPIGRIALVGDVVLVNGTKIATATSFFNSDAALLARLERTETNQRVSTYPYAWTGATSAGGSRTDNCANWTSASSSRLGRAGLATASYKKQWLDIGNLVCSQPWRIYCISQ